MTAPYAYRRRLDGVVTLCHPTTGEVLVVCRGEVTSADRRLAKMLLRGPA